MRPPEISRPHSPLRLIATIALVVMSTAAAAQNRCANCHDAQRSGDVSDTHLDRWRDSSHARAGVGCESCHGGDTTTFQQLKAHRGVKHSFHPEASTHFLTLPATCGSCHGEIEGAYRSSRHAELLAAGDPEAPTCTTCHGALATQSIGGGGLDARCGRCHDAGASHPMPEELARGGAILRRMRDLAQNRTKAGRQTLRIKDLAVRHDFGEGFYKANSEWEAAVVAGHAVQYDSCEESLAAAEAGFEKLLAALDRYRKR